MNYGLSAFLYVWLTNLDVSQICVFPFHKPCLEILAWVLTGVPDLGRLDKNRLYKMLWDFPHNNNSLLGIDYRVPGDLRDQTWHCEQGTESFASNPLPTLSLRKFVQEVIHSGDFDISAGLSSDLEARVRSDPFRKLPYELLFTVFDLLSDEEGALIELANASWPVHCALRGSTRFWKLYAGRKFPWFYELHKIFKDSSESLDGKCLTRLCQWADKATMARKWMRDPMMSIANRRRIWAVCDEIAPSYIASDTCTPLGQGGLIW